VWPVSRTIDRYDTTFDHDGLISNAGLIVTATSLMRLGVEQLTTRWVRTGAPNAGRKICTLIAAMLAGATHIEHANIVRAGATQAVLPFRVMAPSTIGTFLRTFTFGFVRQLDAVASRLLARAWELGAGPGNAPLVIDLDSTICEVHGHAKHGAAYGYTRQLGYHPLIAARSDTAEIVFSRMRKGSAGSSRGVVRFVDELVAIVRRAGATGPVTVRADSGFWSWKLIDTLNRHRITWSITVTSNAKIRATIDAIPDDAWVDIDYTTGGVAQVAETVYTVGRRHSRKFRTSGSSCAAPASPHPRSSDCGPNGDTTPSSPTAPTSTPSKLTPSTVTTLSSNLRSVISKPAAPNTSHPATTQPTPPGSAAP
jgi:hypothetical protein